MKTISYHFALLLMLLISCSSVTPSGLLIPGKATIYTSKTAYEGDVFTFYPDSSYSYRPWTDAPPSCRDSGTYSLRDSILTFASIYSANSTSDPDSLPICPCTKMRFLFTNHRLFRYKSDGSLWKNSPVIRKDVMEKEDEEKRKKRPFIIRGDSPQSSDTTRKQP